MRRPQAVGRRRSTRPRLGQDLAATKSSDADSEFRTFRFPHLWYRTGSGHLAPGPTVTTSSKPFGHRVGGIPRVQRYLGGDCGRGDQEVDCAAALGLASGADSCRVDQAVGTAAGPSNGIGSNGSLQAVLAPRSLRQVVRCVWTGGPLCECDRRYRHLSGQCVRRDTLDLDDDPRCR